MEKPEETSGLTPLSDLRAEQERKLKYGAHQLREIVQYAMKHQKNILVN